MLVSVIIPAKNRVEFTREALISVYSQLSVLAVKLQVILVDDGSDPPLGKIFQKEFKDLQVVRNFSQKHGPGISRNLGLKNAKGDYIAFIDNDDQWKKGFLKHSVSELNKSKAPATVCLTAPFFYGEFPFINKVKLLILNGIKYSVLISSWLINKKLFLSAFYLCQISHMLFNKRFIEDIKFNERTAAGEDWEFIVDVTKLGQVRIIPKSLVKFRYEPKSNTFSPLVRRKKEKAYYDLLKKLPKTHSRGLLNNLFKWYIKYLLVK